MLGASLPSCLFTPGKVILKKFVRSKNEPVCEEVEILDDKSTASLVRFPDGNCNLYSGPSTICRSSDERASDTAVGTK